MRRKPGPSAPLEGLLFAGAGPAGAVLAGKYRLDQVIASGGMGVVVRAVQLGSNLPVAIKFVKVSRLARRDAAARLVREAQAARRLDSPHVVKVFDVGTLDDATPFVVMEYLQGQTFAARLREKGPLPIGAGCRWLGQICLAVEAAHCQGIIHRDLKPANLFCCESPPGEELAKVLDFGLAKSLLDTGTTIETTSKSVLLGSPSYMSPEQIRFAGRIDQRTDIWSLGVVIQELLTGELPFGGAWSGEIFASVLGDLPKPMSESRSDIPAELERAVARCLRKDPRERYADVSELASVLARVAARAAPGSDDDRERSHQTRDQPPENQTTQLGGRAARPARR